MRVISSFHDYYDCMARYDEDRTVIFNRKTVVKRPPTYSRYNYYDKNYNADIYIEFCGKLYYGVIIINKDREIVDYIWGLDKIDQHFLEKHENRHLTKWNRRDKPATYNGKINHATKNWWRPSKDCAIIAFYLNGIIEYPCLKDLEFQRVIPPQQTWMELMMWHNNLAQPEKTIPTVSNSDLIEAKGFNLKTSFRKERRK